MVCSLFDTCFNKVSGFFQIVFEKLGTKIGRYANICITVCLVITIGLSCGMVTLSRETSTEVLYTPVNSRATRDRASYQATFPDATGSFYVSYALTREDLYGEVVFSAVAGNVFSSPTIDEIRNAVVKIKNTNISYEGQTFTFDDVCALRNSACFVSGETLTTSAVVTAVNGGTVTYPDYNGQSLTQNLGQVSVTGGFLVSAKYLKMTFHLKQTSATDIARAKLWENEFLKLVPAITSSHTTIFYSSSQSLDVELNKNTAGDIVFSITFTLMIVYATVTAGGDVVSSRTWAAWAGVLAAGFGILSSFGLISLCGVKFVNIVGVMPFLIIGIGVDDMFLLMSSWADTCSDREESIPYRMGRTFRSAGIGITITSLTDLLAFAIAVFCVYQC